MIPSSIRWRLPLSYAATALLAALLLGAILLLGLRGYYSRREADYLRNNASAVASNVSLLVAPEAPAAALQSQVDLMAFLPQTRVRITDPQGNTVADSGDPRQVGGLGTLSIGLESPGTSQTLTQNLDTEEGRREFTSRFDIEEPGPQGSRSRTQIDTSVVIVGEGPDVRGTPGRLGADFVDAAVPISLVPAVGAQLGLDLGRADAAGARRSGKVARQSYNDELGRLAGYVELSLGPAFGTEVLSSVARGRAASAAVAVALAGAVGWLMSLRITRPLTGLAATTARMSQGDLSARAEVGRGDELGQLANSFNEMAQRVESTVDALQRFVGDSAHQLLTPMTALRTDFEALQRQPEATERATLFVRVSAQLDRLQELSTGLLDLSRIEAGVVDREWTEVDLNRLLAELGESFASRADQSELEFSLSLLDESLTVRADEPQLRQAVGNLIDNAIKFTPAGGHITVSLRREGSRTVTTVEDTGVGIPEADLDHLFDRFHRGRNASMYPGSGLGLAIVKAIVAAHGGEVTAENTASGARFAISLPRANASGE